MPQKWPIKLIIFNSALIFSALIFGFLLKLFIGSGGLGSLVVLSLSGILLLAILITQALLSEKTWISVLFLSITALAPAIPFIASPSLILLAGVVICALFFINADHSGKFEMGAGLKINFPRIAKAVAGRASSGLAIFSIMAYLALFNFSDPNSIKKTLEVAVKPLEPIMSRYIPGFTVRDTVSQLATGLLPDDLKIAPANIRSQVIQEATTRLIGILGQYIKTPVQAGDKVIDIIYHATIGKILNYSPLVRNGILVVAGLVLFFLLKFVLILVNGLAIGLSFLLYQALLKAGILKIELRSIEKEVIVIE